MSPLPIDLGGGALLRRYRIEDLDALWAAVERERDRLAVWMPWAETTRTIDDQRAWLERVLADEDNLDGTAVFVEGAFAGGVGMSVDPFGVHAEIGYWIVKEKEGKGLVTKAVEAMIDLAFGELNVHRVVIRAGTQNVRSRAIPERLGFTVEGTHREEGRGSGGFHDLVVYGLLDREWRS